METTWGCRKSEELTCAHAGDDAQETASPADEPVPLGTNYGVTAYHRSIRPIPVTVGDTGGGELDIAVNGAQTAISTNNGLFTSAGGPFTPTSAPASTAAFSETFGIPQLKSRKAERFITEQ